MKWLLTAVLNNHDLPKWVRYLVCLTYLLWFGGTLVVFVFGIYELCKGNVSLTEVMDLWCKCFGLQS